MLNKIIPLSFLFVTFLTGCKNDHEEQSQPLPYPPESAKGYRHIEVQTAPSVCSQLSEDSCQLCIDRLDQLERCSHYIMLTSLMSNRINDEAHDELVFNVPLAQIQRQENRDISVQANPSDSMIALRRDFATPDAMRVISEEISRIYSEDLSLFSSESLHLPELFNEDGSYELIEH